ncbi:carbamoyltransferase HypF [Nonomuraea sp. FMUSA5-5]|uniref:Carbamoyltransferase n=1 Tax=Nonomuraea composti TaxID=2720023 RepID=A0ABX1AZA2_9ACTN|nr:carbamoyltransferase HypF [Nonomuraea sp. FMUSA5-5]NJP88714.1 carbamoyltransferase HypF [Nonomuraea sp. FMUSA5-5]
MDAAWRIEVHGIVQGVGFRPFVHRLATSIGIRGRVRNAGGHVVISAAGPQPALEAFVAGLRAQRPGAARIRDVIVTRGTPDQRASGADAAGGELTLETGGEFAPAAGFEIVDSDLTSEAGSEIPPDLATCADCRRELFDPANRRYRYPFINCTACGPRATIIESLPYDRERTSMRRFAMCPACAAEYHDPADRRFHAEPIACASCGPRLRWQAMTGDAALRAAADAIAAGAVVAVKGLGGFHLVCDAINEEPVARLREIKARDGKPLAVMVRAPVVAGALAALSDADRALLTGPAAPIVLAPRRHGVLSPGVCHGMPDIGVFLPYTPLHHLLMDALRRPLVVTSANHADSPMPIDEVRGLAVDGVLTHDRPIVARYDDSVIRSFGSRSITIRRGRGLAPALLRLPAAAPPLVAVGAQLKSTFTLADGERAVLGPHIGDLSDAETLEAYDQALAHLSRLHGIEPVHAAHDLHPGYLSTRLARRWPSRIAVQHHHAHVAAVAAEHGLRPPFLGVAYDGLGLGDDGTFWGGELLLASYTGYRRLGRFSRAPMPGGEAAVRRPARMALGYLLGGELGTGPARGRLPGPAPGRLPGSGSGGLPGEEVIARMIARGVNCPAASSAGRLFDAAAALLGLCEVNGFEGEAATRLEQAAGGFPGTEPLAWRLERRDGLWVYDAVATLRDLLEAKADGEPVGRIAAAFHATVAAVTVLLCERAAAEHDVTQVCLAGGVFQNRLLATGVLARLSAAGFEPYIGERVPVNDAGISYGQAAVAAARLSPA